jgi:hypothetical protein
LGCLVERLEQPLAALLVGAASDKFVEQYFYGFVVCDGVLVRVPSHYFPQPYSIAHCRCDFRGMCLRAE